MKLWLVSRTDQDNIGYDEYDAIVVAAETSEEAKLILPEPIKEYTDKNNIYGSIWGTSKSNILNLLEVTCIGTAIEGTKKGTILGSFNAG